MDASGVDALSALFSGIAAVGGIVAVIVAVRALTVTRESASVDQLFAAAGDVLAALQQVGRLGARMGQMPGGETQSRALIGDAFEQFVAARARVDLALESLGLAGDYSGSILDLAHNFAAAVLQADEFSSISRDAIRDYVRDQQWVSELSWKPSGPDVQVLARSASFQEVRESRELLTASVARLERLDYWWGERILQHDGYGHTRSVYSVEATYLTQVSRLVDDFTREYVQPMFSMAVRRVARSRARMKTLE